MITSIRIDDNKKTPFKYIPKIIHNPALIYKLSKLDCVNFIEMTKGYLKKITGFMNKK